MSIWDIGVQSINNKENDNDDQDVDTTMLFVGVKHSGKSTLISRFLDKNDNPKSTVALDYSFGRQTRGHNIPKLVCHVWELGGGTWLQKLVDVVLNPSNIRSISLIIVVDLSDPASIFTTIDTFVNCVKARINFILDKLNDNDETRQYLKERIESKLSESIERDLKDPLLIPLVIIGGKYDKFRELDLKQRTIICNTLRFLNNYYGGTLLFFTMHQEPIVNRLKSTFRHFAFNSSPSKAIEVSPKNPLAIPVGQDSFVDIGMPEFNGGTPNQLSGERLTQYWKRAYTSFFPASDSTKMNVVNPGLNSQYFEKLVDDAKKSKDAELEKYRKLSDRRMRDLQQQAINDGILVI